MTWQMLLSLALLPPGTGLLSFGLDDHRKGKANSTAQVVFGMVLVCGSAVLWGFS